MLMRFDPFDDALRLSRSLFTEPTRPQRAAQVAVDIQETDDAMLLYAEVPGMREEDLEVELDGRVLKLTGTYASPERAKDSGWLRTERRGGQFERRFTLPKTVDTEAIEANLDAGVLTLRLPKQPAATPRKVAITGKAA